MSDKSAIEWTDATWNPVRGCSRVSEGCRNCYAERVAARFSGPGMAYEGLAVMRNGEPRWTGEVRVIDEHLEDPLRWRAPRRIFVNSMSDLFHEKLSDADIDRVFAVMALATRHTFQVLTKRPARMLSYLSGPGLLERLAIKADLLQNAGNQIDQLWSCGLPLRNVWLGVSAEDQATADERGSLLLRTPAAVHFVSAEPLLGPIDLGRIRGRFENGSGRWSRLDWIIVGGESGPSARPMDIAWARSIRDQCVHAGVSFFFKQWGEWFGERPHVHVRLGKKAAGRELDGRTWDEMPDVHAQSRR